MGAVLVVLGCIDIIWGSESCYTVMHSQELKKGACFHVVDEAGKGDYLPLTPRLKNQVYSEANVGLVVTSGCSTWFLGLNANQDTSSWRLQVMANTCVLQH